MSDIHSERILILDFGSQYTQLIARRVREAKVYCEIFPFNAGFEKVKAFRPKGLILSGGPSSVYDAGAPLIGKDHLDLGIPVLGICYGMQLMTHVLGGQGLLGGGRLAVRGKIHGDVCREAHQLLALRFHQRRQKGRGAKRGRFLAYASRYRTDTSESRQAGGPFTITAAERCFFLR